MPKKYKITPLVWFVKDEAGVKFHIKSDDYFGTVATVLSLLEQQIKNNGLKDAAVFRKTFKNLKDDLMFLQKNYQINLKAKAVSALSGQRPRAKTISNHQASPKARNKNRIPKGKLKSQ